MDLKGDNIPSEFWPSTEACERMIHTCVGKVSVIATVNLRLVSFGLFTVTYLSMLHQLPLVRLLH